MVQGKADKNLDKKRLHAFIKKFVCNKTV